jgi:hypothetical protein
MVCSVQMSTLHCRPKSTTRSQQKTNMIMFRCHPPRPEALQYNAHRCWPPENHRLWPRAARAPREWHVQQYGSEPAIPSARNSLQLSPLRRCRCGYVVRRLHLCRAAWYRSRAAVTAVAPLTFGNLSMLAWYLKNTGCSEHVGGNTQQLGNVVEEKVAQEYHCYGNNLRGCLREPSGRTDCSTGHILWIAALVS